MLSCGFRSGFAGCVLLILGVTSGCGTTRWTDTARTATEQMLISDAVERAVAQIDFSVLRGQKVYLDTTYIDFVTDSRFIVSTLRQQILACGCELRDAKDQADFIFEARAGTIGTDRHDLLYGVPAVNLSGITTVPGLPATIPEIAMARRTDQRAVAKLAVFAYHRETGRPVWQSGTEPITSKARDLWVFGAGPFQRGSIYDGTHFAGGHIAVPLMHHDQGQEVIADPITAPNVYNAPNLLIEPPKTIENLPAPPAGTAVPPPSAPSAARPMTPEAIMASRQAAGIQSGTGQANLPARTSPQQPEKKGLLTPLWRR